MEEQRQRQEEEARRAAAASAAEAGMPTPTVDGKRMIGETLGLQSNNYPKCLQFGFELFLSQNQKRPC